MDNVEYEDENITTTGAFLPMHACLFLDVESDGWSCSADETVCVVCSVQGKFLSEKGETIDDYSSPGHTINLVLCGILLIFGLLGTIGNIFIIVILKHQRKAKVFNTMLIGLASFDIICCIFSIIAGFSFVAYFQNWSRGWLTLQTFRLGLYTATMGRTGSAFMTVAIGIERLVVIAFGISGQWGTVIRTRVLIIIVTVFSLLEAIGRITGTEIHENVEGRSVPSIRHLDYIPLKRNLPEAFEKTRDVMFEFAFWAPLPVLLGTYGFLYFYILKITRERQQLVQNKEKDINAAKMIFPVVLIFLVCYAFPISVFLTTRLNLVAYRELFLIMYLSYAINSAVNLPIYYLKGSSFKKETRNLLGMYAPRFVQRSIKKAFNIDIEMKRGTEVESNDTMSTSNNNANM